MFLFFLKKNYNKVFLFRWSIIGNFPASKSSLNDNEKAGSLLSAKLTFLDEYWSFVFIFFLKASEVFLLQFFKCSSTAWLLRGHSWFRSASILSGKVYSEESVTLCAARVFIFFYANLSWHPKL